MIYDGPPKKWDEHFTFLKKMNLFFQSIKLQTRTFLTGQLTRKQTASKMHFMEL